MSKQIVVTDHHIRTVVVLAVVAFFVVIGLFARFQQQSIAYAMPEQTSPVLTAPEPVKPVMFESVQEQKTITTLPTGDLLSADEKELLKNFSDFSAETVKPLPLAEEKTKEELPLPLPEDKPINAISVSSLSENELVEVYAKYILEDRPETGEDNAREWSKLYVQYESKYNFPRGILVSIGHKESTHNPNAVSTGDAYGLLQVQFDTGKEVAEKFKIIAPPRIPKFKNEEEVKKYWVKYQEFCRKLVRILKNPERNVEMGSFTLNRFLKINQGDWSLALRGYSGNADNKEYFKNSKNYGVKVREFHAKVWRELEDRARASALAQDTHFRAENNPLA